MKVIPVHDAVGMVLGHDITRIVPGEDKGPVFRRGHVVRPEDISMLLSIGKEHLYVFDLQGERMHEDDAAKRIAGAAAGQGISLSAPCEGKVVMTAEYDGLVRVDSTALYEVNSVEDVVFSSIHTNQFVRKGRALAGTRVIPLVIGDEPIAKVEDICRRTGPLVEVRPFAQLDVGVITTGSEIFKGRIKDGFGPVLRSKFSELGCTVQDQVFVSDDRESTVAAIHDFKKRGAGMIVLTGGMSVDPDDQTPASIRASGAEVVTYGAPVLPGAMFMLAYLDDIPVLGLPGCVMYFRASIFDLIVPRILAGDRLTRADIVALGHGGFCEGCATCRYPACGFGKGV
jgi:hypothetical protein